ncbi:hypothetical protein EVG20_g3072 [Dentipellis fragilis]|uniref:N-acetyltransferase domain-containing protein n=1 Tax=Dentipellis fragilis TaxID=205917 RepID=A0A4Y9Z465_9AGAM|nr:hypothetical protein EVG20_g3072 [Dentipellis fragilis]
MPYHIRLLVLALLPRLFAMFHHAPRIERTGSALHPPNTMLPPLEIPHEPRRRKRRGAGGDHRDHALAEARRVGGGVQYERPPRSRRVPPYRSPRRAMSPAPTKSHASRVNFASLTLNNLGTVRKLNSVLFPIKYSEKFYQDILLPEAEDFCKLGEQERACDLAGGEEWTDRAVSDDHGDPRSTHLSLYHRSNIMPTPLHQPYRHLGIGSKSLELILESAASHTKPKISRIYLHVQISNDGAKQFYERHGFEEIGVAEHYYKKIVPSDAWILQKTFAAQA